MLLYMYTCPMEFQCQLKLVCIFTWKVGCPCVAVFLCPIHLIFIPTTCIECVHASVHVFMFIWLPISCYPPFIVTWKHWCHCVPLCDYSSNPTFGSTPWLECVHASVHGLLSTWLPISSSPDRYTYMDRWIPLCLTVCVFQSLYLWSHILNRRRTCTSTCTYVNWTPNVCFNPFAYLPGKMGCSVWHCVCLPVTYFWSLTMFKMCTCITKLIYVLTWLPMSVSPHLNSFMKTWVHLCDIAYVCSSHSTSGNTPWLECVHASVHVFMSIWLLVSPQNPMHSYTETWEPLCGSVFMSQSLHFCSFTLFIMCTCISTCIYVQLTLHVCSTP